MCDQEMMFMCYEYVQFLSAVSVKSEIAHGLIMLLLFTLEMIEKTMTNL